MDFGEKFWRKGVFDRFQLQTTMQLLEASKQTQAGAWLWFKQATSGSRWLQDLVAPRDIAMLKHKRTRAPSRHQKHKQTMHCKANQKHHKLRKRLAKNITNDKTASPLLITIETQYIIETLDLEKSRKVASKTPSTPTTRAQSKHCKHGRLVHSRNGKTIEPSEFRIQTSENPHSFLHSHRSAQQGKAGCGKCNSAVIEGDRGWWCVPTYQLCVCLWSVSFCLLAYLLVGVWFAFGLI